MITLIDFGFYRLFETKTPVKVLVLGTKAYVWVYARGIGDILVKSTHKHTPWDMLSTGQYRIFAVDDETSFSDQLHLELMTGDGEWQGYLLPTGLPTENKHRVRIIPTYESVSAQVGRAQVAAYS